MDVLFESLKRYYNQEENGNITKYSSGEENYYGLLIGLLPII